MDASIDDVLLDAQERMEKTVELFADNLKGIRAGAASAGLVENIRVDCYGSQMPISHVANIGVPDPQLIVIRPYDPNLVDDVVKAIQRSDIGIQPQSDGKVIRLVIPGLSEERRRQLVSRVREMAEEARVAIRNIRRDANKSLSQLEKASEISEDESKRAKDEVQDLTDEHQRKINETLEKKVADIMKV